MTARLICESAGLDFPLRRGRPTRRRLSGELGLPANDIAGAHRFEVDGRSVLRALDGIDLRAKACECVALVGANGAGKTSLLRLIAGVYAPSAGRVETQGTIATLFSSTLSLSDRETGRQNIAVSAVLRGIAPDAEDIARVIGLCSLGGYIDMPVATYSDGMRARLGLVMALIARPDILLIDEAMTTIDAAFITHLREAEPRFLGPETLTIMASHSRALTDSLCTHALWLERGRVRDFGPYSDVMSRYMAVN